MVSSTFPLPLSHNPGSGKGDHSSGIVEQSRRVNKEGRKAGKEEDRKGRRHFPSSAFLPAFLLSCLPQKCFPTCPLMCSRAEAIRKAGRQEKKKTLSCVPQKCSPSRSAEE